MKKKLKNVRGKNITDKGISLRQQRAADLILQNQMVPVQERKNKLQIANEAGFVSTASLHSEGVNRALQKYGLNEDLVTSALVDDIRAKPEKRLGELTLAADILGMRLKKDQGEGNKTLILVLPPEIMQKHNLPVTDIANRDIVIRNGY